MVKSKNTKVIDSEVESDVMKMDPVSSNIDDEVEESYEGIDYNTGPAAVFDKYVVRLSKDNKLTAQIPGSILYERCIDVGFKPVEDERGDPVTLLSSGDKFILLSLDKESYELKVDAPRRRRAERETIKSKKSFMDKLKDKFSHLMVDID